MIPLIERFVSQPVAPPRATVTPWAIRQAETRAPAIPLPLRDAARLAYRGTRPERVQTLSQLCQSILGYAPDRIASGGRGEPVAIIDGLVFLGSAADGWLCVLAAPRADGWGQDWLEVKSLPHLHEIRLRRKLAEVPK